jgi:hypothetical protein
MKALLTFKGAALVLLAGLFIPLRQPPRSMRRLPRHNRGWRRRLPQANNRQLAG